MHGGSLGAGSRSARACLDVGISTSTYALDEARRNCDSEAHRKRLERLAGAMEVTAAAVEPGFAEGVELPESDRPILAAAIAAGCTQLLSGDRRAFGAHYGATVGRVLILRPAEYLAGAGPR